jgi:integration host factor subunit alpha
MTTVPLHTLDAAPATGATLTKADLVESVHKRLGLSKKESAELVEKVFETIKTTLIRGEPVKVSGFGKFDVRLKHARRGRNPKTDEKLIIPEHYVLSFKPSQGLKLRVAGESLEGVNLRDDE